MNETGNTGYISAETVPPEAADAGAVVRDMRWERGTFNFCDCGNVDRGELQNAIADRLDASPSDAGACCGKPDVIDNGMDAPTIECCRAADAGAVALTDQQWLKAWTKRTGRTIKPGRERDDIISDARWAESVVRAPPPPTPERASGRQRWRMTWSAPLRSSRRRSATTRPWLFGLGISKQSRTLSF